LRQDCACRSAELEHDPFADAPDACDQAAIDRLDRWVDGAKNERAVEKEPGEALSDDVPRQRLEVDDDIGEFGNVIS
jgi:hypothetical protein